MARPKKIEDQQFLDAARRVFLSRGVHGATKEIAKEAGISEAAVFARHKTIDELFVAAMRPTKVDPKEIIAGASPSDLRACLILVGGRVLDYLRATTPRMLALFKHPRVGTCALQGPMRDLRGAIKHSLYPIAKHDGPLRSIVDPIANRLVIALFGRAVSETLGFQNEWQANVSVTDLVDAVLLSLRAKKPKKAGAKRPSG